jgi:hypothetical protein
MNKKLLDPGHKENNFKMNIGDLFLHSSNLLYTQRKNYNCIGKLAPITSFKLCNACSLNTSSK